MVATLKAAPRITERDPVEFAGLYDAMRLEREWFAHHPVFPTVRSIYDAAQTGRLAPIYGDGNVVPIARLRNPAKQEYPSLLHPTAALALRAVTMLWRAELVRRGINRPEVRLAATSFVRSVAMQQVLIQSGALASERSTHCVGWAFDLDESGYYTFLPDSGLSTVAHPDRPRATMAKIATHLDTGDTYRSALADEPYDPTLTAALGHVIDQLYMDGKINRLHEFPDTANQCAHIAPNPSVSPSEWQGISSGLVVPAWMG